MERGMSSSVPVSVSSFLYDYLKNNSILFCLSFHIISVYKSLQMKLLEIIVSVIFHNLVGMDGASV